MFLDYDAQYLAASDFEGNTKFLCHDRLFRLVQARHVVAHLPFEPYVVVQTGKTQEACLPQSQA
jgi:hypothetical protein